MLSDQDVERELKAALLVAPSPDFEARVLQRVDADRPSRRPAHSGWFAAAASLIIVAGVFYALNRRTPVPAPQIVERTGPSPQVVDRTARASVAPPPEVPDRVNTRQAPRVGPVHVAPMAPRRTEPDERAEPEIIVSLNQMEAVRRLVRAVNEGRVEVPADPPPGPMAPPPAVTVAPVVVEPIPLSPLGPVGEKTAPLIRRLR